jgi:hypothetical protein
MQDAEAPILHPASCVLHLAFHIKLCAVAPLEEPLWGRVGDPPAIAYREIHF